ncbi:acetolactate synthase small subunit [Candidatus Bathyarchaeota archaeon]|nr:acetolactate synthase small subunit [Candidatus Bathyarchaeota archaeon]
MSTSKRKSSDTRVPIALLVYDHPGVMMKVTGLFARRGFNIASISVGHSEREGFSRITIVAEGDEATIEQIIKQLNKLVDVVKVQHLHPDRSTMREFALVKVDVKDNQARQEIMTLVEIYRGKVIDVTTKTMTVEVSGSEQKVDSFIDLLSEFVHIKEIVRSGLVALLRGEESITLD